MKRSVLVTGAAGGIGRAICEEYSKAGLEVIGVDRHACDAADLWLQVDLGDLGAVRSEVAKALEARRLVALVHNAAVQPLGGAGMTPYEEFVEAMRVNVLAADSLVAVARDNLAREQGSIVVVSSVHAAATTAGINAYATTKAALEGWVRSAAIDLGPSIRVNAVRPGAVDTAKLREGFARWGSEVSVTRMAVLESRTPLRRVGRPSEVAAAVRFLTGPDATFITGSTLVIDGGASACLGTE